MVKYFDGFGKEVTGYVQTLEEENENLKLEVKKLVASIEKLRSTPKKKEKKTVE